MLGRFVRATIYAMRVYGGPAAVMRAAFMAVKHSGVSGVFDAITFAMRHSGRVSIRRAPRYKKVQTVQRWLEPLVIEAATIEPKIMEINLKNRLADPIYFHSPNDLSEAVKSILEANANEEVTHIILGRIYSTGSLSQISGHDLKTVLHFPSSRKISESKGSIQGARVALNETELPSDVFAKAVFHVITTIQPSVVFLGELDDGLKMAVANIELIKLFSDVRSF